MIRLSLLFLTACAAQPAWTAETCHYAGTTSYSGRMTVDTVAAAANGETTVDIRVRLDAKSWGLIALRYLHQEISVWRNGALQSVAVNHRYGFNGSIVRQQWDVFVRGPDGMRAYRVQGKTLADFQNKHPGFARNWEMAAFGRNWLPDYQAASPERRADLDLPRAASPPGLGPPLAQAFYWVRWNTDDRRIVPVFLPGFKRGARVDVPVVRAVDPDGLTHFRFSGGHPALGGARPSIGEAWVSADRRLARVSFDAVSADGGAHGELRRMSCEGDAPPP